MVQAAEIGGVKLEPRPPVRTHDRYYDTETGDLLRQNLALRVREQGGQRTAGLRTVDGRDRALPDDLDLLGADGQGRDLVLPPGALAAAVREVAGDAALEPLLSLRQYRTPRVARDGEAVLGGLSFDVVVYEVPGSRVVSNEVEVHDRGGLLDALAPVFDEQGLEPAQRSTFARALLRHPRTLGQPVLLLPDEARALEHAAAQGDTGVRRRAAVALLDARGFRPDTIAAQTGMSMARVKHWRQRFREVRLGVLEPEPSPAPVRRPSPRVAAVRPSEPSIDGHAPPPSASRTGHTEREAAPEPPAASREPAGDGMPGDPSGVADMAELLELFSPSTPDTPLLSGDPLEDESDALEDADDAPAPEALPLQPRNPYPVVLGPVPVASPSAKDHQLAPDAVAPPAPRTEPAPPPVPGLAAAQSPLPARRGPPDAGEPSQDPFAEVDLRALRRDRAGSGGSARYQATDDAPATDETPEPAAQAPTASAGPAQPVSDPAPRHPETPTRAPAERAPLHGDTPLPLAARRALGDHLGQFEARADAFLVSRAPSDARKLLIAAQRLRLTVETFGQTLPPTAVRRLISSLRPLVDDLDAGLDYARGAALSPARRDLARLSAASVASAAARLGSGQHHAWGARSHRLLAHLDRQHQLGLRVGDYAAVPADDFVGAPGDVPAPTRLRHILGSALWARFEAVRAFQDDLAHPTPDLAAHLAVALSALRFVLGLVEATGDGYVADVSAALDAAERSVARARHRAVAAALGVAQGTVTAELAPVAEVWSEVTAPAFKKRLATVAAAV